MSELVAVITAPHYVAAIIVKNEMVIEAAPILRWSIGKPWCELQAYCEGKNYKVEILPERAKR